MCVIRQVVCLQFDSQLVSFGVSVVIVMVMLEIIVEVRSPHFIGELGIYELPKNPIQAEFI